MTLNPAQNSPPPPDRAVPVPAGVAPSPCEVVELDWSGSPAQAAVGQLLETAHLVDRLTVQLVEHLVRVVESGATDQALGVAVELVLSQSARMVRFERTALLRAATTLVRMPAVRQAFRDGLISWSQVRAIITAVGRLDVAGRDEVDALVGQLARAHVEFEADALVHEVDWLVAQLVEQRAIEKESEPVESNRTVLAGRLDGSGTLFAELDADHFPWAAQAIDNRADDRFPFEAQPHPDDTDTAGMSDAELTAAHRHAWQVRGRNASRRAKAMFELLTGRDAATLAPLPAGDPATTATTSGRPAVSLTCSVEALLDGSAPAWVLNRLGGRIQVTSATARKWLDVAGADARLFLFDDCGEVVGYGRRRRHADGWLRDAIIARDLHDTAPGSTTPGPLCEVDHVQGWASGGATDAPNLTLLSMRFNNAKSRGDWQLTRHRDGTRTWTVPTTGYRIRQPRPPHLTRRTEPRPDPGPSP